MLLLALLLSSCTEKEKKEVLELVSAETVTISARGGDVAIEVNSTSGLTAESSAGWAAATVVDKSNVKVAVDAYEGNEPRTATVTITNSGNVEPVTVRINQAAVNFTFTPSDYEFGAEGGQYSFPYEAEAALKAAAEDADWLAIEVKETELVLSAAANEVIKSRAADVEWSIGAAKGTFTVSQKAAEANLESADFADGNFKAVTAGCDGAQVVYEYTTNSELEVSSDEDWIETYTEDGKFCINVLSNTGNAREGAVEWAVKGSETLKGKIAVSQKGVFMTVSLVPTQSSTAGSNLTNTIAIQTKGTGVTAVRFSDIYTETQFAGADADAVKASTKTNGRAFTDLWLSYVNNNGLNLTISTSCTPSTTYYVVVWATNGDDEAYYVISATTLSTNIFNDYDKDSRIYPVENKSQLYGNYYFLARTTESLSDPWGDREFLNTVTFSDGESSVDEEGFEYNWINVEGIWNSFFNANYRLSHDIYQFDLYEGLLYSQEGDLGDLIKVADGSTVYTDFDTKVGFEGSGYVYGGLYGVLGGGVVDEDGTIALISTENYASETDLAGDVFGNYMCTFLFCKSIGWLGAAKDFMFIPVNSYSPAKAAAAARKADAIKKEYRKTKMYYCEIRDTRLERAFKKVLSENKPAEAAAF